MKVLIAPDSFKDSLPAKEVAAALCRGIRKGNPQAVCHLLPMADGGEGTLDAWLTATGALEHVARVQDPLGRLVDARWGWHPDTRTALVEMAEASGLQRLALDERNAGLTSTFGTGELIRAALEQGAEQVLIGLGGSATNDAGTGMLSALGVRWLDRQGQPLPPGGLALTQLTQVDWSGLDPRCKHTEFQLACDVTNPLLGPRGASYTFGPQKGAEGQVVAQLEEALNRFNTILMASGVDDLNDIEGGGAAGGCAASLARLLGARLVSGIDLMLDCTDFRRYLTEVDWVITGEGRIDDQTAEGKTVAGIARRCSPDNVPVIAIGGSIEGSLQPLYDLGVNAVFSVINRPCSLAEALKHSADALEQLAADLARLLSVKGNKAGL